MGRHSAPDDDDGVVMTFTPVAPSELRAGRHARPDDDEPTQVLERPVPRPAPGPAEQPSAEEPLAEQETERIGLVEPPTAAAATAQVPAVEPPKAAKSAKRKTKGSQATAADLALLRAHSALRARVIAAVVVPFVLYTVAMYLLTWLDVYFIWVWIPLVSAGVLAGSFLDAAHRRYNKPPAT
jgi:hypothetical protein